MTVFCSLILSISRQRESANMSSPRPTAHPNRQRSPTWSNRFSHHTLSPPPLRLMWKAALCTPTWGSPACQTPSAASHPGPLRSINATQEKRGSSSPLWTCRYCTVQTRSTITGGLEGSELSIAAIFTWSVLKHNLQLWSEVYIHL